ncbi:MAG: AraC family transcriptional regulator [Pseudomonadota bacterium]
MTNGNTTHSEEGYDTFYQYANYGEFVARPWTVGASLLGTCEMGLTRLENVPAGHYPDPPVSDYALQYIVKGNSHASIDLGANRFQGVIQRGRFIFAPPATSTDYEVFGQFSLVILGLASEIFEQAQSTLNSGSLSDLEKLHTMDFKDPLVQQIAIALWSEAEAGNPQGALYADHMTYALAAQMLKLSDRVGPQETKAKPLDDVSFEKVRVALEDQLDERVTLTDLAAIVGMDVYQFSRSFRARTGQSPYNYFMGERIKRVEGMLSKTSLPLADIAYACGFSSQSHMTSAFSKAYGTSPGVYRRELAS